MSHTKQFEHLKIQLDAIKSATNNFADDNCIGKGGFGKVYKGELIHSKGHTMVALKHLDRKFGQGTPEFWKEVIMLSLYKHENIVSLLGFCDDSGEKILVYEYASKKSLDLYLNSDDLTWLRRLNICIGAARGLAYLHNPKGSQQRLLHRDIKSSNILLDENWNAKISDFGLSKFGPANQQYTFLVSDVVGTVGYCDPQYVETGLLTKESDVYSFGVVLFEVLCGRLCIGNYDKRQPLTRLARHYYEEKIMDEIIYSNIKDEISHDSLQTFTAIAYRCLKINNEQRPLMTEVVTELENALQYQVDDDSEKKMELISTEELLSIEPHELQFPFELKKQSSCSIQLKNKTDSHVAFKVETTNLIKFVVQPNIGIVLPCSTCDVTVTMKAQKNVPLDLQCTDKFLLQSAIVSPGASPEDITRELESCYQVKKCKLKVNYVALPKPPSPVREESEDGSPTRASISDNETSPGAFSESYEKSPEVYGYYSISNRYGMDMSVGKLLSIEPQKLKFPFEPFKQIPCSMLLKNKTDCYVAFKVKTTNPKNWAVKPNLGIVLPRSTCHIIATRKAQKEAPDPSMQFDNKFLLQSAVASPRAARQDIPPELFIKESDNQVEVIKWRVNYVDLRKPPSVVREGSDEGSPTRASINDKQTSPRALVESHQKSSEGGFINRIKRFVACLSN